MRVYEKLPEVVFRMGCKSLTTTDLFSEKRIILFALPGAFTPTCSSQHLPMYERLYSTFKKTGVDEIYCLSVNDSFVMDAWALELGIKNVKMIPDGNGDFTRQLGMLVKKDNLGFGDRSWRYAILVDDGVITEMWIEPGKLDNSEFDPYSESSALTLLNHMKVRDDAQEFIKKSSWDIE